MFLAPKILDTLKAQTGRKYIGLCLIHAMCEEAGPSVESVIKQWFCRERPDFIMKFFTWRGSAELQTLAAWVA